MGISKIKNIIRRYYLFRPLVWGKHIYELEKVSWKNRTSRQYSRVLPWFRDNGDKTLRLNYDLNEQATVFDLGGYEGQWASDIFSKYGCTVLIFEPYKDFAEKIKVRFSNNKRVSVFDFGLADEDKVVQLSLSADASSLFKTAENSVQVELKKASAFLINQDINKIDLMKVNIEGGEYDLMDHLIESGVIKKIKNIQIQFHDFVPNGESRMRKIQNELSRTHFTTYSYEFVWENWKLKE